MPAELAVHAGFEQGVGRPAGLRLWNWSTRRRSVREAHLRLSCDVAEPQIRLAMAAQPAARDDGAARTPGADGVVGVGHPARARRSACRRGGHTRPAGGMWSRARWAMACPWRRYTHVESHLSGYFEEVRARAVRATSMACAAAGFRGRGRFSSEPLRSGAGSIEAGRIDV